MRRGLVGTLLLVLLSAAPATGSIITESILRPGGGPCVKCAVSVKKTGTGTELEPGLLTDNFGNVTLTNEVEVATYTLTITPPGGTPFVLTTPLLALRDLNTVCVNGCCTSGGTGSPEGVETGFSKCDRWDDTTSGTRYRFNGTLSTNTGWVFDVGSFICGAGANLGAACTVASQCPGGTCGPAGVTLGSALPVAVSLAGGGGVGVSTFASREDHRHACTPASVSAPGCITAPGTSTTAQDIEGNKLWRGSESTSDTVPIMEIKPQAQCTSATCADAETLSVGTSAAQGAAPFCEFTRGRQLRCQFANAADMGNTVFNNIDANNNFGRGMNFNWGPSAGAPYVLRSLPSQTYSLEPMVLELATLQVGGLCVGGANNNQNCVNDSFCSGGVCDPTLSGSAPLPAVYGIHQYHGFSDDNAENYCFDTAFSVNQGFVGQGLAACVGGYTAGYVSRAVFGTHKAGMVSPTDFRFVSDVGLVGDGTCIGGGNSGHYCSSNTACGGGGTCTHTNARVAEVYDYAAQQSFGGCISGKTGGDCTGITRRAAFFQRDGFDETADFPYFLLGQDVDTPSQLGGPLYVGVTGDQTVANFSFCGGGASPSGRCSFTVQGGFSLFPSQGIQFQAADANQPTCSGSSSYFIWADQSEGKLKKCQAGVSTDLDLNTGGGSLIVGVGIPVAVDGTTGAAGTSVNASHEDHKHACVPADPSITSGCVTNAQQTIAGEKWFSNATTYFGDGSTKDLLSAYPNGSTPYLETQGILLNYLDSSGAAIALGAPVCAGPTDNSVMQCPNAFASSATSLQVSPFLGIATNDTGGAGEQQVVQVAGNAYTGCSGTIAVGDRVRRGASGLMEATFNGPYMGIALKACAGGVLLFRIQPGTTQVDRRFFPVGACEATGVCAGGTNGGATCANASVCPGGTCVPAVYHLAWSLPASNPASKGCVAGTDVTRATLDFPDGADKFAFLETLLPIDWNGRAPAVTLMWESAAATGAVVWQVAAACVGLGEDPDPTFNTASATAAVNQTANRTVSSVAPNTLTMTGCAANEMLYLRVNRNPGNASDTATNSALLVGALVTIER